MEKKIDFKDLPENLKIHAEKMYPEQKVFYKWLVKPENPEAVIIGIKGFYYYGFYKKQKREKVK